MPVQSASVRNFIGPPVFCRVCCACGSGYKNAFRYKRDTHARTANANSPSPGTPWDGSPPRKKDSLLPGSLTERERVTRRDSPGNRWRR